MTGRGASRALTLAFACCVALALASCARPASPPVPSPASPPPVSAMHSADRLDAAHAEKIVLAYITALRSHDASAAAALMTPYRQAETRAPSWAASTANWKSARVQAVTRPGRYIADERSFAELYAHRFGREPYKLVVLDVSYSRGPGTTPGYTDFVVTQDSENAPWLINDFGGAPSAGN